MFKPKLVVTVVIATIALLAGLHGIPSGKSDSVKRSNPTNSSPSGPTRASRDSSVSWRNAVVTSEKPPVTAYPEDPEFEYGDSEGAPMLQEVAQRTEERKGTGIVVNGRELTRRQIAVLIMIYHQVLPPGRYWYDSRSGAWGFQGRETMGVILPGHDFGSLSPAASGGNTGVFINGRELNWIEKGRLQQTFRTIILPSRWWLDGRSGYYGREGNPIPMGNFRAALASQGGGQVQTDVEHVGMGVHTSSTGCSAVFTGNVAAFPGC